MEVPRGYFVRFLEALGEDGAGVVAIDGKTLRRSFDKAKDGSAVHVVTAFAADVKLVRGGGGGRQRDCRGGGAPRPS